MGVSDFAVGLRWKFRTSGRLVAFDSVLRTRFQRHFGGQSWARSQRRGGVHCWLTDARTGRESEAILSSDTGRHESDPGSSVRQWIACARVQRPQSSFQQLGTKARRLSCSWSDYSSGPRTQAGSGTTRPPHKRNIDLSVATGRSGSDRGGDLLRMLSDAGPLGATAQNDEGNTPGSQVLLVAYAPVSCEEQLEACLFGCVQQGSVAERVPAFGLCRVTGVPGQRADQSLRRAVVKEDEHRRGQGRRGGSVLRTPGRLRSARGSRRTAP